MILAKYIEDPRYRIYLIVFVVLITLAASGAGLWFFYKYYENKRSQDITIKLAQFIEDYDKSSNLEDIKELQDVLTVISDKYKNSKLYPFLIAYKSDIELKQNNEKRAIELLDDMVNSFNVSAPLYYVYAMKRAFLKLNSKINSFNNQGYTELKTLSNDVNNPLQVMAIYHLGLYEFYKGNESEAKKLFETVLLKAKQSSGWYFMAKTRLRFL